MVFWKKKAPEPNGWEDEEDKQKSDPRFKPGKEAAGGTYGDFTKSDGKTIPVKEVKTDSGVHYRQTKEFLDDEEFL